MLSSLAAAGLAATAAAGLFMSVIFMSSDADANTPGARAFEAAFGRCPGEVCVVRLSPGGELGRFLSAAVAINGGAKRLVIIDGPCNSACAIFADYARDRVCVTDRASFGFHKGSVYLAERYGRSVRLRLHARRDPDHSYDIAAWVQRNGGFPRRGMNVMTAGEATQFWRRCRVGAG
jgi:hypothetical protein